VAGYQKVEGGLLAHGSGLVSLGAPLVGLFPLVTMFLITLQGVVTAGVAFGLLDVHTSGPVWAVVLLAVASSIVGMALGLFLSAFARSEFQAVQFMPAVIVPQLLLAGLFLPRDRMPQALQTISDVLPFTYAYEALAEVAGDDVDGRLWLDIGVGCGCIVLALVLGAATLRRRTA